MHMFSFINWFNNRLIVFFSDLIFRWTNLDEIISFSAGSKPDIFITCNDTSIMIEKKMFYFSSKDQPSTAAVSLHWLGRLLNQILSCTRHLTLHFWKFVMEICQPTNEELSWKTPR